MFDSRTLLWLLLGLPVLLLTWGCASTTSKLEGAYRGPERFGSEAYETSAPTVDLAKKVRVVLLTFSDERKKRPEMDWTRQADVYADSVGQPLEVRPELERAILSGIRKNTRIELVPEKKFLKDREADVVISGRIIKCEAQRGANIFVAQTVLEITLRDEFGNPFWKAPLKIQGMGKTRFKDTGFYDEIDPGNVGAAMTEAIQAVANDLLQKRPFNEALARSQKGPQRDLAAEDFQARRE